MSNNKYISEIQGLRALAVISVVLFHVKFPLVTGGFIGVDVFFVISGYVITLIIKKEMLNNQFSLRSFFVRRFWRIFPALLVTVLFTNFLFLPLNPSSVEDNFLYSAIASTFGIANIYYFFTLDYFSSGISNPLLHTWSLGVEEQFYLLFPLVLVISNYFRTSITFVLSTILIVSFFTSSITAFSDQSSAFYLPWYRAWEFSLGSLIAWKGFECKTEKKSKCVSWVGITALLCTIFFYRKSYIFPGLGALLPALGTMCLLISTNADTFVNKVFRTKFMKYVGDISYSVYLVHWPFVCFVGLVLPIDNLFVGSLLIIISFSGGVLLHRFVELPVLNYYRKKKGTYRKLGFSMVMPSFAIFVMFVILSWSYVVNDFWERNPKALEYLTSKNLPELFRLNECFFVSKKININKYYEQCIDTNDSGQNILITGDSLSANVTGSLISAMPEYNFMQASAVGYKPGMPEEWSENAEILDNHVQTTVWGKRPLPDLVIYFAMWENQDLPFLIKEIKKAKEIGSKVIVIGPPVDYITNVPLLQGISEIIQYDFVSHVRRKGRKEMDKHFMEQLDGIVDGYLSVYEAFCTEDVCVHKNDYGSYYTDKVHLSFKGIDVLLPELIEFIEASVNNEN